MIALDSARRTALEGAVVKARRALEQDLAAQAEGRLGIYPNGTIDEETVLSLSQSELMDRREVLEVLNHLRAQGEASHDAFDRLVREASFTHLNRLFGIRVAEAIGLLQPSLSEGRASVGFREVLEVAPLLSADTTGGYWTYLRLCGDELAADAPGLFDPRNPLLALAPSPAALDELVALLSDKALTQAWDAPDTFGWAYQFFNTAEERRQMREAGAPRTSRELAVRNQFFTPRYVVDFLVHNSLGRRLLEAEPDSAFRERLDFLVAPPEERGKPLDLEDVKVLDPACGSGHFLLGCYDLLEAAWDLQGVDPAEAAARILPALWGIDIDPRCAQVCSAALVLRARRHRREGDLGASNIITARPLPNDSEVWNRVLADLAPERQNLIAGVRSALEQAPLLGSLLKVEDRLASEIRSTVGVVRGGDDLFTAMGIVDDAFGRAEADVLAAVQRIADETVSSAVERIFAAEATDAIRFVEAMRQRYDAVLMNPPFGEPIPETKTYLKSAYPWIPWKDYNLLSAFVGRGLELADESGYVGAITSRSGFFLTTFERWRREVVLGSSLVAFADLGHGVMSGAKVEAAAYVMGNGHRNGTSCFIRLLRETDRPEALRSAIDEVNHGEASPLVSLFSQNDLLQMPGAVFAYRAGPEIRRLIQELPPLEGNGADVRVGLQTSDDTRFVRAFWEVRPQRIATARSDTTTRRWVPFAKGGEYSLFYADIHLLVDWHQDGKSLRDFDKAVIRSDRYYFRGGITWPERINTAFSPRVCPEGTIFSVKGPICVASDRPSALLLLAWLSSRFIRWVTESAVASGEELTTGASPSRDYSVGLVQRMPWLAQALTPDVQQEVESITEEIVRARAEADLTNETTRIFIRPHSARKSPASLEERASEAVRLSEERYLRILEGHARIEELLHDALDIHEAAEEFDATCGPHPLQYPKTPLGDEERTRFARLYRAGVAEIVREAKAEERAFRYLTEKYHIADRLIEVLAHVFERHPGELVRARRELNLLPSGAVLDAAEDLVSWLFGCAMGRFDVRVVDRELTSSVADLFSRIPACSAGMLTDDEGFPELDPPEGYPLALPANGLLVDEVGHTWDVVHRIEQAFESVAEDSAELINDLQTALGQDLRTYLRKSFFKAHLARYSKGFSSTRRRAPIYWHLSVPSRRWGIWVYAPVISRETLFAVEREAERRFAIGKQQIRALRAEHEGGGKGRSARDVRNRLSTEEALCDELQAFRAEAERIANLGWEPDLDDGIILCAAPLADLLPAWPETAKERDNLRGDKHEWATVARWKDDL